MVGQTISHYKVTAELGRGSMGVVYKAEDLKLDRTVALKFLAPHLLSSEEAQRRFIREAKAAAALDHPNICTVYEIDDFGGQMFIAMAFIEGQRLDDSVKAGLLKLSAVLDIAIQVGEGLKHAHKRNVVHRDIKSANIILSAEGPAKILDFGLARLAQASRLTKDDSQMGTPAYMSPEQASGNEGDRRSDIWSLGVVLYETVSGRLPFPGEYHQAVLYSVLNEDPEPLSALRAGVPRELDQIISKALTKDPDERYQHMDDLLVDLRALHKRLEAGAAREVPGRAEKKIKSFVAAEKAGRRRWSVGVILATALVLFAAGTAMWLTRPSADRLRPVMRRLTSDADLTFEPTISPDGKLVAYASDRSGEGNLDLWMRQVDGGPPIRLTDHETDDHSPHFSPDGTRIAFRSERDGGGIYVVSTLGGDAQLIAVDGRNPQFSPDGQHIAYWVGVAGDYFVGKMYIVSADSGTPQQLRSDFSYATHPIWHPDGEVLLFRGRQSSSQSAWWVTPLDGGPAVDIRMFRCSGLAAPELIDFWIPSGWTPDGSHILFSARLGDSTNIWRLPISTKSWQVSCDAERLTSGIGEFQPSMAADGRLAFASVVRNVDVWSLPVDADSATVIGEIEQVTHDGAMDSTASVSADGKIISFVSNRSGHFDVWIKNLETGKLAALGTSIRSAASFPVLSADGSMLAYTMYGGNKSPIYSVAAGGGLPQKICDDCGPARGWSPDGKRILYQRYAPGGLSQGSTIGVLNAETGEDRELLRSAERKLFHPNFSPDDSWITLHGRLGPERTRLLVIPLRGGEPAPEGQWIKVTNREGRDDKPCWSPNGSVLYFISERDGYRCIWARRLNPKTKQPVGESFAIHHFHHARLSMMNLRTTQFDLAVARDKLVFTLSETSGNIWLREPPDR